MQGDIVGIVDSIGNLVVEYKYDAWGKPISRSSLTTAYETLGRLNPFRYRGYVYDEETELYYLRSRYYNPEWGRFVNADACMGWSSLIGKNLYMYCSNGPIVFSDSNGFSPEVTPSPSRPANWDTAFYARMLRQKIKATITRVAKTIVNKVKSVYNAVKKAVKKAALVAKASQLTQHGGGVIKFNTGLKATCYTSEYWYRTNRPASSWGSFAFDAGLTASGAVAGKISALSKISPYLEGIGIGMLAIDACINLQVDQINRCIDSLGIIGWISWERSVNAAPMPTAWDSTTFTPGEWFGEIESVEFFE